MTTASVPQGEPQTMLEWALHYLLVLGWPIFPVCSPRGDGWCNEHRAGKHPADKVGKMPLVKWKAYQEVLPLEVEVRGAWRRWPNANIGCATGLVCGFVVIDLDSDAARMEAKRRGYDDNGPFTRTGRQGGQHRLFAYRADAPTIFAKTMGVDFRGQKGFVILPPSVHRNGTAYEWGLAPTPGHAYPPLPYWIDDLAQQRSGTRDDGVSAAESIDIDWLLEHGFDEGERDDGVFRVAAKLRGQGASIEEAYATVEAIAAKCNPPFDGARAKVDWAWAHYEEPIRAHVRGGRVEAEQEELVLRAPAPIFPIASLPLELRNYARFSSLPTSALASAGLPTLGVAIGGEAELSVTSETMVRAITWNVPIGLPSAGKSPAGMKLFRPLREQDATKAREYAGELKDWMAEDEHHGPAPVEETLVHGSLTVEALFDVLDDTPCILQAFDELSHFMSDLGRYGKANNATVGADSGDAAMYLEGWTGAPMRARRIGQRVRGKAGVKLYCERPTVSLWGPLTVANQGLLGGEGSGFRCRWLPYLVQARTDLPAGRIFDPGDVGHPEYATAWDRLIERLLARRDQPRWWWMPTETRQRVEYHRARWQARARSIESSATVTAALGKADVAMESIALILAEADLVSLPVPKGRIKLVPQLRLSVEVADRAAAWVDYCVDVWAALGDAQTVSFSNVDRMADTVVTRVEEWIAQHGVVNDPIDPWVWENDLFIHKVAGVRTRRDWRPTLDRYQELNPGHIVEDDTPGKPGRKPRQIYAPRYRQTVSETIGSDIPEGADFGSDMSISDPPEPISDPPEPISDPPEPISDPPEPISDPPVTAPSAPPLQSQNGPIDGSWVRF